MTYRLIAPKLWKSVGVLFAFALLSSCSATYTAAPIRGKVVDALTKQPIAGANVLVTWSVYSGTHSHFEGYLEVKEAVTNEKGEFLIDGWGPTKNQLGASLTDDEPKMIIFKPWYHIAYFSNYAPNSYHSPYLQSAAEQINFYWDSKTIDLKTSDDRDNYILTIGSFQNGLYNLYFGNSCDWEKSPKLILAASQFFKKISEDGYRISKMDISYIHRNEGCPTLENVFGEKYQ